MHYYNRRNVSANTSELVALALEPRSYIFPHGYFIALSWGLPNNEQLHHINPFLNFVSEALQNSSSLEWNSSSAMGYIQTPSGI